MAWVLVYRLHGATLEQERIRVKQRIGKPEPQASSLPRLIIEFTSEPTDIPERPVGPPFRTLGTQEAATRFEHPSSAAFDVHGCWLRVTAFEEVQIDEDLYQAFLKDDHGTADRVRVAIGEDALEQIKDRAAFAAGALAVLGDGVVLEEWASLVVIGKDAEYGVALTPHPLIEYLPDYTLRNSKVPQVMSAVVPLFALPATVAGIVQKSLRWFARGRQERPGTTERFVGLFLAIEAITALSSIVDNGTAPKSRELGRERARKIAALSALVEEHGTRQSQKVLQGLIADHTRPSLVSRFRWLAEFIVALVPPDARWDLDHDVQLFSELKKIRDDLFHGLRDEVPHLLEGKQFDNLVLEFVNRYLRTLILVLGAAGQNLIIISPTPESDDLAE